MFVYLSYLETPSDDCSEGLVEHSTDHRSKVIPARIEILIHAFLLQLPSVLQPFEREAQSKSSERLEVEFAHYFPILVDDVLPTLQWVMAAAFQFLRKGQFMHAT